MKFSLVALVVLQIADVVIHVATGQIEPLRIASNVVILAGSLGAGLGFRNPKVSLLIASVAYLALNIAFLARHGVVNPATESFRSPLFGFVVVSLLLNASLYRSLARHRD